MRKAEESTYKETELLSLLEAFKQLNSNIEINEVFQDIILQMVNLVDAEAGTLWVVNDEEQMIEACAVYGSNSSNIINIKLKLNEGIVGKVISTSEPHLIENVMEDASWATRVDQQSGFTTKSMMTVPLIAKEKVIGALQLLNKKNNLLFTRDDLKLSVLLANQAALALHNSQIYDELARINLNVIRTLAKVLDARDPYTSGHSERVAKYSRWIAENMGMDAKTIEELYKAALLHDIGKIGIPDEILRKTSRLTNEEYIVIKTHPIIGAEILSEINSKGKITSLIETAKFHHERLDGSGYPNRLIGDEIPLFAKIVGVADTFDAMTTDRPYHKGLSFEEGIIELERCKDTLFDDHIVHSFIKSLKERKYVNREQSKSNEVQSNESV
ncbi:HD domain-containing phosphohydrolase [Bacillus sp. JJ664]